MPPKQKINWPKMPKIPHYTLTIKFKVRTKAQAKQLRIALITTYNDMVSEWAGKKREWIRKD